jgi:predicted TIM-barrel fold metal-dependent hydrolase
MHAILFRTAIGGPANLFQHHIAEGFMDRRAVLAGMGAMAVGPAFAQGAAPDDIPRYSSPVIDMHFHMRATAEANIAHQVGAGVTAANLLTVGPDAAQQVAALQARDAKMFPTWFNAPDIARPEIEAQLTAAVKAGAKGVGEIKAPVASDGPEMRRLYALAAELDVPILIHFQDPVGDSKAFFNTGIRKFGAMLDAYPKTKFIAHANSFWANVSANNDDSVTYPEGPVVPGGISDKLLSDYANLHADLSATSANALLSRDTAFTVDFLKRHQEKLHFGSDCGCSDGRGGSPAPQASAVAAGRGAGGPAVMRGKCIARENLALLTRTTTPEIFRKLAWSNAHRLIGLPA